METEVYKGNIIRVTEEKIGETVWERAYVPHGVIIFPMTDEGKILLIEEKRPHESPPYRLKPVSGILEYEKGSPEENAQREMQEEIGYKAQKMEMILKLRGSGTINHTQYFYLAEGLIPSKLPNPDGEDTILAIKAFTLQELQEMLKKEEIRWSMSTLGMFRLFETLKQRG